MWEPEAPEMLNICNNIFPSTEDPSRIHVREAFTELSLTFPSAPVLPLLSDRLCPLSLSHPISLQPPAAVQDRACFPTRFRFHIIVLYQVSGKPANSHRDKKQYIILAGKF